ncbi:TCP pilus virulence regulatory protein [compost metagenome]
MSRMQLHRKLKTLLGVSATEFLRNERIKAAAVLVKKGALNISEIAYNVGFNDVSYFSKCFKETWGVTPSDYASNA